MNTSPNHHHRGFTLVELLVTVAIIATLAVVSTAGYLKMREKAQMTIEINAARNLVIAYLADASDHNGRVMPGYQTDPDATDLSGKPLTYPMNARYPWRLAPLVPRIEGIMLFNGNESALREKNSDYLVSVMPNLGINATLLGGHYGSGSPLPPSPRIVEAYGKFYLSHLSEATDPGKLIVFASARAGENRPGYFEIRPPNLTAPVWSRSKFSPSSPASAHGFVDFRYSSKAVTACLAGNVELQSEAQLRDMTRWSHQAANANDPKFLIRRQNQ